MSKTIYLKKIWRSFCWPKNFAKLIWGWFPLCKIFSQFSPSGFDHGVVPPPVGPTPRPNVYPVPPGTHLLFSQSGRIEHIPLEGYDMKKDNAKAVLHLPVSFLFVWSIFVIVAVTCLTCLKCCFHLSTSVFLTDFNSICCLWKDVLLECVLSPPKELERQSQFTCICCQNQTIL